MTEVASPSMPIHHERIPAEGMDCSDCTLAIEYVLRRAPGVLAAPVSYAAGTLSVECDDQKTNRTAKAAHTGNPGDGELFAGPVTLAQRIRTGGWGGAALRP
jgi:copper chaperone CopZ